MDSWENRVRDSPAAGGGAPWELLSRMMKWEEGRTLAKAATFPQGAGCCAPKEKSSQHEGTVESRVSP